MEICRISRMDRLITGFDRELQVLERAGASTRVMKDLYEIKYDLRSRIMEIENKYAEFEIRGLFPVIPADMVAYHDLMTMVKVKGLGGFERLPSPAVKNLFTTAIKPYLALNPMIPRKAMSPGRRHATAEEIISYAIVTGLSKDRELVAMASVCEDAHPAIRLNASRRAELVVTKETNGEMLSLSEMIIR